MPRTELLLFDAAGTLIEPAEPVAAVYRRHFSRYGWEVEEEILKAGFRKAFSGIGEPRFGHGPGDDAERDWWREVVAVTAETAGIDRGAPGFGECFAALFDHYAAGSAWTVFPEVVEVLADFRKQGFRMAVVSNFDRRLHRVLEELGLAEWFDLILTSADVSARKPSPVLLQTAMNHFSVPPSHAVLVGDSRDADGGAAAAAGVRAFILDRPTTDLRSFASMVREIF
ncbi:HAD-IA family hydrolase [Luteolibacter sp. SL250]|uniref:HAD-IA family hydrolase n=1 Tax=Luteolibacter sp. SL250 TaxID=2995170 RepID=UPI0022705D1F|nr:HAD-IA family hydrolase [Luteolibacter sp. SL250]WAC20760.1 HAD-IA family hydrolase [Luteolibacter sp. SL250]